MNVSTNVLSRGLKWFFAIFFLSLAAVVVAMLVSYRSSSGIVQEKVASTSLEAVTQSTKQMDYVLNTWVGLTNQIQMNPVLKKNIEVYFDSSVSRNEWSKANVSSSDTLNNFLDVDRSSVYSIALIPRVNFTEMSTSGDEFNDTILHSRNGPTMSFTNQSKAIVQSIIHADGSPVWIAPMQKGPFGYSYMPTYTLGRLLKNLKDPSHEMVLLIELKASALFQPLGEVSLGERSGTFISDFGGNKIVDRTMNNFGAPMPMADLNRLKPIGQSSGAWIFKADDGEAWLVLRAKSKVSGWFVTGYLPLSELVGPMDQLLSWSILAACAMLLVFILAFILSSRFAKLLKQMQFVNHEIQTQNDKLAHMDKLKNQILANTSHELRTPLNGIIGLADSMVDGATGELNDVSKYNLGMIISSGRRLLNLVNDILDFSKLRSHDIEMNLQPLDLYEVTDLVLNMFRPLAEQKKLGLNNAVSRNLASVHADPNRLQQIFYNLIGNAIKFTQQGEVTISARSLGDRMIIMVRDSGIGIPMEAQERIFESFEQADGEATRVNGGTGLGLAVTKTLVELQGGQISVTSMPGQGSTFTFTISISELPAVPLTEAMGQYVLNKPLVEINSLIAEPYEQLCDTQSKKSTRILIVDDEPINLQVLENHLMLQQYEVFQASSGPEALEWLTNHALPDVMVLDVMMPGMTGFDVCREIRKTHHMSELPIILLTAKNQVHDLITGFSVGANDYLVKPFTKQEFIARLNMHIQLGKWNATLEAEVQERTMEIQNLLDHVGQGFLSFDRGLLIDERYSSECKRLFGKEIAGIKISELLFEQDELLLISFPEIVHELFDAVELNKQEMIRQLLPNELNHRGIPLQLEYKLMKNPSGQVVRMMMMLTDVTEQRSLQAKIDHEQSILKMIVKAVTHRGEVHSVINAYREFVQQGIEQWIPQKGDGVRELPVQLFRIIHTFKGSFAQLGFVFAPKRLHEIESELASLIQHGATEEKDWILWISSIAWMKCIGSDIERISHVLGHAYWVVSDAIEIQPSQLRSIEHELMNMFDITRDHPMIEKIRTLYYVALPSIIQSHEEVTIELAHRMNKSIDRFTLEGDYVLVDPDQFKSWSMSLVHVFRNIVDHAIDTFDDRMIRGKNGYGTIKVRTEILSDSIEVRIEDDGKGLPVALIRRKLVEKGIAAIDVVERMSKEQVIEHIFLPSFSTKDTVNEISGRGIGLCAVRSLTEEMGGTVHAESEQGKFTRLIFTFPKTLSLTPYHTDALVVTV